MIWLAAGILGATVMPHNLYLHSALVKDHAKSGDDEAISNAMVGEKTNDIAATGADTLLAGDLGCLMNMAGKLQREGRAVKVRHVAEVLADMGGDAAIGEGR